MKRMLPVSELACDARFRQVSAEGSLFDTHAATTRQAAG